MSDEWQLPAPKEDPEARTSSLGDGAGCPVIVPDGNFVEGDIIDDGGKDPGRDPALPS
jgi:hypothetical protein